MGSTSESSVVKALSVDVVRPVSRDSGHGLHETSERQQLALDYVSTFSSFGPRLNAALRFLRQEIGWSLPPVSFPLMGPINLALGQKNGGTQRMSLPV